MQMTNPLRLLCVDDEPQILASLRRFCRNQGFEMLATESAQEALTIVAREPVTVVLSDFRMPQMNGLELLRRIRERCPGVAGIILSGYADIPVVSQAIQQGDVYAYTPKPWDREELAALILKAAAATTARQGT